MPKNAPEDAFLGIFFYFCKKSTKIIPITQCDRDEINYNQSVTSVCRKSSKPYYKFLISFHSNDYCERFVQIFITIFSNLNNKFLKSAAILHKIFDIRKDFISLFLTSSPIGGPLSSELQNPLQNYNKYLIYARICTKKRTRRCVFSYLSS